MKIVCCVPSISDLFAPAFACNHKEHIRITGLKFTFIRSLRVPLLLLWIISATSGQPKTIRVPQDSAKIQSAINAAVNGDTVLVPEGTYVENIRITKKIMVASEFIRDNDTSHISRTVIDGGAPANPDSGAVVTFSLGADSTSAIIGFTITNGKGNKHVAFGSTSVSGGGIDLYSAGAKIVHNRIVNNAVSTSYLSVGAGISCVPWEWPTDNSFVVIENNLISNNALPTSAVSQGAGVALFYTTGRIAHNEVIANSAQYVGGISAVAIINNPAGAGFDTVTVQRNVVQGNRASINIGGVWIQGSGMVGYVLNNTVVDNISDDVIGGLGGEGSCTAIIDGNYVSRNRGGAFGGIYFWNNPTKSRVTNNIVTNNIGSGIITNNSSSAVLINNTVVGNSRYGIFTVSSSSAFAFNNIVWNNVLGAIAGNVIATYNLVQGGYAGTNNNIDAIPFFTPNDSLYHLTDSSYAIARGADSVQFDGVWYRTPVNDYFGSSRPKPAGSKPDMGAYEHASGVARDLPPTPLPFMGKKFQTFYERVVAATEATRSAIVDSFLTANPVMPFIEDTIAHFVYRDTAGSVNLWGDFNRSLEYGELMTKLSSTDLWFKAFAFERDARLDYKFFINGSTGVADSRNPRIAAWDPGASELAMPLYVDAPEIKFDTNIPHGSLFDTTYTSTVLGNSRTIRVYTPPGYNPAVSDSFPVVLFHDGLGYITKAQANNTLDYLIHHNRIKPVIAVFVPPVQRDDEYAFNLTGQYAQFIVSELMPYIDNRYRTRRDPAYRATVGVSFGGLISANICYNHSDAFGLCGSFSGAYATNNQAVLQQIISGTKKSIKFYADWGTYEVIGLSGRILRDGLITMGYDLKWKEWHEGHSWGSWRAHLDESLEFFFPGTTVAVQEEKEIPTAFTLMQNYPNPFNPSTTMNYELPTKGFVTLKVFDLLGREVAVLVNEEKSAGRYSVQWNAAMLPSGVYFYRLDAGSFSQTRKLLLLK